MLEEVLGMQVWAINHKFKEGLPTLFLHWLYAHEVERIVKCVIKLTELMHVYRFSWQKTCLAKKVLKLIWCIFCTSAWFLLGRASTKNYLEHNLFTVHRKIQVCSQKQKDRVQFGKSFKNSFLRWVGMSSRHSFSIAFYQMFAFL